MSVMEVAPETVTDPVDLSLIELGGLMRSGALSPVELTQACLDRIARYDGALHSFITVCAERALEQAAVAGRELSEGLDRGPFHGIPFALKDNVDTAGILSSSHSKIFEDRLPVESATVASKLEAAGGILIGKTATFEFAIGGPSWDLP